MAAPSRVFTARDGGKHFGDDLKLFEELADEMAIEDSWLTITDNLDDDTEPTAAFTSVVSTISTSSSTGVA